MNDIYQKLAEHLDTLPQRYPVNTGMLSINNER
jgi:hypothetical protein